VSRWPAMRDIAATDCVVLAAMGDIAATDSC
jgi:hypothetical protein